MTTDSGSLSTPELKLSEPGQREVTALLTNGEPVSELVSPLLLDHTEETTKIKLDGSLDQEETSETMDRNVSMFTVEVTLTTDISLSGTATMVSTKPGGSIKTTRNGQDNQLLMERSSNSDLE